MTLPAAHLDLVAANIRNAHAANLIACRLLAAGIWRNPAPRNSKG